MTAQHFASMNPAPSDGVITLDMPDEIVDVLVRLSREDRDIAIIALQVLPLGTRTWLRARSYVVKDDDCGWQFTTEGWNFMAQCAAAEARPRLDEAKRRLQAAVDA